MKKIYPIVAILLLVLAGCASNIPFSKPDNLDRVAIANFRFWMDDLSLPQTEDKGKINILTLFRMKEIYKDFKQVMEDSLKFMPHHEFLDSIYFTIENGLRNELKIPVLPLKMYANDIQCDFYGFPLDNAARVAKCGKFDAAMDISVRICYPCKQGSRFSWGGVTRAKYRTLPKLIFTVKMVAANGNIIWRDRIVVKSNKWLIIDEKWLMAMNYKQDISGPSALELTKQAIEVLSQKNKNLSFKGGA